MTTGANTRAGRSAALKVLGVAALMALLVVVLTLAFRSPAPGSVTGDTLAIRLIGVRPDGGDAVYDAAGRRAGEDIGTAGSARTWQADEMSRELIFALPEDPEPVVFHSMRMLDAGNSRLLGVQNTPRALESHGRRRLYLRVRLKRSYRMSVMRVLPVTRRVRSVDIVLRYYRGERGPATFTFTGPFQDGVTVQDDSGGACKLTPKSEQPPRHAPARSSFHVSAPRRLDFSRGVVVYDAAGARHVTLSWNGSSGGGGTEADVQFPDVPLDRIAAVAIGEEPLARTFHNVRVAYADLPVRTHAAYLDDVASRLGLRGLSDEKLGKVSFKGAAEAVQAIDVVRGDLIRRASERIVFGRPAVEEVGPEQRERMRDAARRWMTSFDPAVRLAGVQVGLKGGWREFLAPALEFARSSDYMSRYQAARAICAYAPEFEPGDYGDMGELLMSGDDVATTSQFVRCLAQHVSDPAASAVLLRLAQSNDAWLWWRSIGRLTSYHVPAQEQLLQQALASAELHARIIQVAGPGWLPGESLPMIQAAYDALPDLLSPELFRADGSLLGDLLRRMDAHTDHRRAAAGVVTFLQRLVEEWDLSYEEGRSTDNWWAVDLCVKYLNRWCGQDIAGLGADVNNQSDEQRFPDWRDVAGRAIAWYRDNAASLPADSAPQNPARVVLPDGVIVELAAVGDYPSDGARWWRPDGTPLAGPPEVGSGIFPRPGESVEGLPEGRPVQLVLKLTNWNADAGRGYLRVSPGAGVAPKGLNTQNVAGDWAVSVHSVPSDAEACTATIDLWPDPWRTLAESDGSREVRVEGPQGEAVIGQATEAEGGVMVAAECPRSAGACRLTALLREPPPDAWRAQVTPNRYSIRPQGQRVSIRATFGRVRLEDVASFRLQARPLRRVVFENVSMEPGHATQVKVSGEGFESAASE